MYNQSVNAEINRQSAEKGRCDSLPATFGAISATLMSGTAALSAGPALAEGAIQFGAVYQGDLLSSWTGDVNGRARALDSAHLSLDADLSHLLSRSAPIIHADLNMTSGAAPNDDAQTLQGVDNIEVGRARTRLYELWVEQRLLSDHASLRAGFQELNSEFYATDSAGLLINPSFGLSPEIGSTGSNGASTYPSTAIGLRAGFSINNSLDVKVAAFNADALNIGDKGGPDLAINNGALTIGQVNWHGAADISVGAWTYTQAQDDIRNVDSNGDPIRKKPHGLYVLLEKDLWGAEDALLATGFVRAGSSDGGTTPFSAAWQAGVLISRPLSFRPDSAASIGLAGAKIGARYRANEKDVGIAASRNETSLELTYSDKLTPWLSVQPDLQFAMNPGGDKDRDTAFTAGLRITIEPWSAE